MIEVIYKEESQETQDSEGTFGLPRNIRQIGLIGDDCRIYMEDYVYTFLVRLARSEKKPEEQAAKTAVLTGETDQSTSEAFWRRKGTDADGAAGA